MAIPSIDNLTNLVVLNDSTGLSLTISAAGDAAFAAVASASSTVIAVKNDGGTTKPVQVGTDDGTITYVGLAINSAAIAAGAVTASFTTLSVPFTIEQAKIGGADASKVIGTTLYAQTGGAAGARDYSITIDAAVAGNFIVGQIINKSGTLLTIQPAPLGVVYVA